MFYAGKMLERRNGAVVRDLTTTETETGNVYVVAPVPASMRTAIKVTGQLPREVRARVAPPIDKSAPRPRSNGHSDVTDGRPYKEGLRCQLFLGMRVHSHNMDGARRPEMMRRLWRDQPVSLDPGDAVDRSFRSRKCGRK